MTEQIAAASNRPHARVVGFVYLLFFVTAISGALLARGIVVPADAEATAKNIMAHETLFRAGSALGLLSTATYLVLTALLYLLFKPVSKTLSLVAAFTSVAGCAIQSVGNVFQLAPSVLLSGSSPLGSFTPDQTKSLALVFLKLNGAVSQVALVFFGLFCFLIGWLIYKSTFLPQILGAVLMFAGIAWLAFPFLPVGNLFLPFIEAFGVLAEGLLMLWLLVMGVDVERWTQQAAGMP
jgi:hypothetical protein